MITLQAYAEKNNNDFEITLKIIKDLSSISKMSFVLPKEKSSFINLTENLYNSGDKPTYQTKKEFKENFIDYTLSQNFDLISAQQLTDHYNGVFKLDLAEAIDLISKQDDKLEEVLDSIQNQNEELISKYNASQPSEEEEEDEEDDDSDDSDFPETVPDPYDWDDGNAAAEPPPAFPVHNDTQNIVKEANSGDAPGTTPVKPKTANTAPVVDLKGLDNASVATLTTLPADITATLKGCLGDRLIEAVPALVKFPGGAYLEGENNAAIMCSRDELYGLKAHTKSGAVYVVAGRSPNNIKTEVKNKPGQTGPLSNTALEKPNDLVRDSAYLYLSQKSDPHTLLRCAGGTYAKKYNGPSTTPRAGLSLAAIKADDVVIMARESGIRLITGTDATNSSGGDLTAKFGIELIAGNDDSDLQPLVKGDNLKEYLVTMSEVIKNLRSVLYNFITSQLEYNATLAAHKHFDPFSIFIGTLATGNPLKLNGGRGYISSEVATAGQKAVLANAQQQANAILVMQKRINNDNNAFGPLGSYKIKSEKNKTN